MFALGTYVNNSTERTEQVNNIDHGVGMALLNIISDGSPLVRKVCLIFIKYLHCVYLPKGKRNL